MAEGWILSLELHSQYLDMREGDRVSCATYMFRDDASLWEIFFNKYFSADVSGRLTREFMSLRQGDSSVAEFIRKFDKGCHFVPIIARDTVQKLRNFLDGLQPTLRRDMMLKRPGQQRPPQTLGAPKPEGGPPCKQCNKIHYGKCMWGTFRCFTCKEEGHKAADCPRNQGPITGRAYVIHAEEAEAEPDSTLITDNFYV
ncbi:uncharacterized protein [Primulina huaijiensis]|uniref:uncharacterized protein n=1 Tax=Primulina huaijiensis TaxID=1492673 RepID=UPI003CC73422